MRENEIKIKGPKRRFYDDDTLESMKKNIMELMIIEI